jgi:hypothetical protein
MQPVFVMGSAATAQNTVALAGGKLRATEVVFFLFNSALLIAMLAMIALAGSQIAIPV